MVPRKVAYQEGCIRRTSPWSLTKGRAAKGAGYKESKTSYLLRRITGCRRFRAQDSHDAAVPSDRLVLFGAWLSLVERLVRDQEVQSSNLCAPTNYPSYTH